MMKKIFPAVFAFAAIFGCKQSELADLPVIDPPVAAFRVLDSTQMSNDLKALSSDAFKGRKAGMPEVVLSHQLIQNRLRQAGVDSFATGFTQDFIYNGTAMKNFLGLIKGSLYPDKYIVVSAHFDHLGVDVNGIVYHGADDNASGVAATLAMAKYFQQHKPAYSIIFALWDGEEVGLRGSSYFVNNLPAELDLTKIKFNLNADMLARSDNNSIWASGLSHYPAYAYLVDSIKTRSTTQLKSGYDKPTDPQDWTLLSDHGSFYNKGIAYLYLGVEDHPDYHKTTDTFDKIDPDKFTENANIFAQMAMLLDRKLD
jgi:Zn-dependent M28 family amino/carboxypeptidase